MTREEISALFDSRQWATWAAGREGGGSWCRGWTGGNAR